MADIKISQLPAGTANSSAVVPATNAAGNLTEKITLAGIAALVTDAGQLTLGTLADARLSANVALKSDITSAISGLVDSAPNALNTLDELAAALNDDASFATTVTNAIAGKANASHSHAIEDVTNLQSALNGKVGSSTTQAGGGTAINNIVTLTQAQYDAIAQKDSNTLYLVQ